ncbi:MAG TPA: NAD(P)-dependent oxidoreductase [Acidimicrobiia bacterium]
MAHRTSVAVLGTGAMGTGIAHSLLRAGHDVTVWNRTASRARPLANAGATVVEEPEQAAAAAGVVVTMLADGAATEAAATAAFKEAHPDTVWVQMATVGLQDTARLGELARELGVQYVDAPVSGTRQPAEDGKLVVLASGPTELRERCAPVFDAVGQRTVWVGEVPGTGMRAKLVVNAWLLGTLGALAETVTFAESLGLDPEVFFATVKGGPLDSPYVRQKGAAMMAHEYPPSFSAAMAAKDARLIDDASGATGGRTRIVDVARAALELAEESGRGGDDLAVLREFMRS